MARRRRVACAREGDRGRIRSVILAACLLVLAGCVSGGTTAGETATGTTATGTTPQSRQHPGFLSIVLNTHDPAVSAYGFTALDATQSQLGTLPTSASALVWVGGYDEASCAWFESDAKLRDDFVRYGLASDPRVIGYFLADEPNSDHRCPGASRQVRDRAALVRELDPDTRHFTLVNIDDPNQFAAFRHSADVLATDPYPCRPDKDCDWRMIPAYIARLRAAGVTRYMALLQAFADSNWRWPTADELSHMIVQWRRSDWCGALTFSWTWDGGQLADHPDLLAVLRSFNQHLPVPPASCAPPAPSQSSLSP